MPGSQNPKQENYYSRSFELFWDTQTSTLVEQPEKFLRALLWASGSFGRIQEIPKLNEKDVKFLSKVSVYPTLLSYLGCSCIPEREKRIEDDWVVKPAGVTN